MRSIRFLLHFLATVALSYGTAQSPDILIFDGAKHSLFENPLESAFDEAENPKPRFFFDEGVQSTANWRGYVATWELTDGHLYLRKIEKSYPTETASGAWQTESRLVPAERVFPGKDYPLKAEWYSGVLRVPQGALLRYVHMGYGSTYEREILLEIEKGRLIARRDISRAGENLFRSDTDLQWAELGPQAEDTGSADWIDGRLLFGPFAQSLKESGESFKVRGIYFSRNGEFSLWIPDTPKTRQRHLPIHRFRIPIHSANGSHVELTARFVLNEQGETELHADALRPLRGGETIHSTLFPALFEAMSPGERALLTTP